MILNIANKITTMDMSSTQLVPVWVKLLMKKAVIIQIIKTKTAD